MNKVVPKEKLREAVEEFVGALVKRSPIILKFAKLAVNKSLETSLSVGLAYESDLCALVLRDRRFERRSEGLLGEENSRIIKGNREETDECWNCSLWSLCPNLPIEPGGDRQGLGKRTGEG